MVGILAWIAGAAYQAGYWGVVGLENGLTLKSIQHTALMGFIGAVRVWFFAVSALIFFGTAILFFGIKFKKSKNSEVAPIEEKKLVSWIRSKVGYDESVGQIGLGIILAAYLVALCLLLPMMLWSVSAYSEGKEQFIKGVCELRNNKVSLTDVKTEDGQNLSGNIIDRTENAAILLDSKRLHFLKMKDETRLQYSLNLPEIECKLKDKNKSEK